MHVMPRVYTDPILKQPRHIRLLMHHILRRGLIVFVRQRRAKVGVFTVGKKDDSLRLIFVCRPASFLHGAPPNANIATAGFYTHLDFLDATLEASRGVDGRPHDLRGSGVDREDGFYQFRWAGFASYFCLGCVVTAEEAGITEVRDEVSQSLLAVAPDDSVFAAPSRHSDGLELEPMVLRRYASGTDDCSPHANGD